VRLSGAVRAGANEHVSPPPVPPPARLLAPRPSCRGSRATASHTRDFAPNTATQPSERTMGVMRTAAAAHCGSRWRRRWRWSRMVTSCTTCASNRGTSDSQSLPDRFIDTRTNKQTHQCFAQKGTALSLTLEGHMPTLGFSVGRWDRRWHERDDAEMCRAPADHSECSVLISSFAAETMREISAQRTVRPSAGRTAHC
jgi:hypothetical protein